ncbi:MAG: acetolactate decarboxylase [Deltaproteobacteria bacterium]|nr:acetolactate decarboxylase [Deltaproteobacteria bacterium]
MQYGKMHEVLGKGNHEGRVLLREIAKKPHFFGVGALEQLSGEVTIVDGKIITSRVGEKGKVETSEEAGENEKAALLIGAYVPSWNEPKATGPLSAGALDDHIAKEAKNVALDTSEPFVFRIEGELVGVKMHVVHGACPIHARLKDSEIPSTQKPYMTQIEKGQGTIIGVFATDAVGNITHPATASHMHVIMEDPATGKKMTGHLEEVGLGEGATLQLPKSEGPMVTLLEGLSGRHS